MTPRGWLSPQSSTQAPREASRLSRAGQKHSPDHFPDGFGEAHVQKSIGFVQDQVADLFEGDPSAGQEVLDATRSPDQNVAAWKMEKMKFHTTTTLGRRTQSKSSTFSLSINYANMPKSS